MRTVITTSGLTKRYRGKVALVDVTLEVPRGVVFGYLGPNGAGKTTTIRLLAGLLRPTKGHAAILGADTVRNRAAAQAKIGYLPGEFVAYPGLTVAQYLTYLGHLRGGVDPATAPRLAKRLDLDLSERIGAMSHGNRQKVGIMQAFLHEPEVLILDEPTAGLDPLVQREFLSLVRETRESGRTVLLSSHVLSEVEAVADQVGILRGGRLVDVQSVAELKRRAVRRIDLTFEQPPPLDALRVVPGVREVRSDGAGAAQVEVEGSTAALLTFAAPYRVSTVVTHEPNLEQIFLTYYGQE